MNTRTRIVIVLGCGALAVAGLLWHNERERVSSLFSADADSLGSSVRAKGLNLVARNVDQGADSEKTEIEARSRKIAVEPGRLLWDSKSYSGFLDNQPSAGANSGMLVNNRTLAAGYCNHFRLSALREKVVPTVAGTKATRSDLSNLQFWEKYCDAPAEDISRLEGEWSKIDDSDDIVRASRLHEIASFDKALAFREAVSIVKSTRSGDALLLVHRFMEESGAVVIDLGETSARPLALRQQFPVMRQIAFQIVACELDRNCGPDSLAAWVNCAPHDLCQPGVSMQMIWQRSNSPQIYEGAMRMADRLRAMRR
jgi:hypothetical protein